MTVPFRNFPAAFHVTQEQEMVMRAHLANLPFAVWALIGLPVLVVTRCVVMVVVPEVVHAVVPQVVRTVLHSI